VKKPYVRWGGPNDLWAETHHEAEARRLGLLARLRKLWRILDHDDFWVGNPRRGFSWPRFSLWRALALWLVVITGTALAAVFLL
jgi:hypothetical protein